MILFRKREREHNKLFKLTRKSARLNKNVRKYMSECKLDINPVSNFFASWIIKAKCNCCGRSYYRNHPTSEKLAKPAYYLHLVPVIGDLLTLIFIGALIVYLPKVVAVLCLSGLGLWSWDVKNEALQLVSEELVLEYQQLHMKQLLFVLAVLVAVLVFEYGIF